MPPLEDLPIHLEKDIVNLEPGVKAWRCRICGHVHYGGEPPEECPYCFFPTSAFKAV
jgi:acyl-CoA dehydrogenase